MNNGQFGRARWGVSAMALAAAVGFSVPAVAQVNEILISATRRAATTVQDVPLAVTAYGGDTLQNAGVKDVRDLVGLAPSFQFLTGQSNAAGTTAYLRGLGTGGDNPGFESAVGFFVDGVYRNRSGVALSDLPAVDRVEVLRGPQGTLFGKNTSAGAISVITAAPSYTGAIYGSATLGNLGIQEFDAGFTGPLDADHVAVRLDAVSRKRDGYITDVRGGPDINDRDRWMVRGQALIDLNDTSSFRAIFDVSQTNEICCGAVNIVRGSGATAIDTIRALGVVPGLIGVLGATTPPFPAGDNRVSTAEDRRMTVTPGRNYGEGIDEWGVSGEYNAKIWGDVDLTSITSYRDWRVTRSQDIDFSDLDRAYRDGQRVGFKTFTQEFRLHGKNGAFDWLVGGYYVRENLRIRDTIRVGADAAEYVDMLAAAADLNGPLAPGGTGFQIFGSLPVAPIPGHFLPSPPLPPLVSPFLFEQILQTPVLLGGFGLAPATAAAYSGAIAGLPAAAGQGQNNDNWRQNTSSWALFTHNQIALGPNWMLTLGARYNDEHKSMKASLNSTLAACGALNGALVGVTRAIITAAPTTLGGLLTLVCNPAVNTITNGTWRDSIDEGELSGTASLSWQWSDNTMFYVSYSRGYKAGGFNLDRSGFNVNPGTTLVSVVGFPAPSTDDLDFTSEIVKAWEAGWKWQTVGGNLILNGAVFHQNIQDYQLNAFSGFNFITFNVPEAITRGVEIDLFATPMREITWQGGVTFLEAYYNSTVVAPAGSVVTAGQPIAFSPKWSVTSAVTWTHPWGANTNFIVSVDGRWNSRYRVQTISRDPRTDNDEYAVINGRLGFAGAKGGWALELWGKNLFDEFYHLGGFAVPEQPGNFNVYPSLQRTYGVTGRIRF